MNIRKHTYIILTTLFLLPLSLMAAPQEAKKVNVKKELATARTKIKSGKDVASAEASMRNLLKDSANIDNEKVWLTLFDAVKKQYEQLNEQLYLKQQSDTAKFFIHTLHMFDVLESMDSIDARRDTNGEASPKYRKAHSAYLDTYRANLYNGGGYYIGKQDYAKAYGFFAAYVGCASQPLFAAYNYFAKDKLITDAAYWALYCGYKMQSPAIVEAYAPIALGEKNREVYVLQYMAEMWQQKQDMKAYCKILEEGFAKYPENSYFFPHLAMYYGEEQQYDKLDSVSDKMLAIDAENVMALAAKSTSTFQKGQYKECIEYSDRAIKLDSAVIVPYVNAGLAYYNQAVPLAQKKRQTKAEREQILHLYKQALPYLERNRKDLPDAIDVWGEPLYNIYLNLNMGDEFEEMERLINLN